MGPVRADAGPLPRPYCLRQGAGHARPALSGQEANRYFKQIYEKLATKGRNPNVVSRLEVKDRQRWVQLTIYLKSHGRRGVKCRDGVACRPTRRAPGHGPMTVREMLRTGFGPFETRGATNTELLARLRLLTRMSYMKDAYLGRMRVFWAEGRFRLDKAGPLVDFHAQFGSMPEGEFRHLLRDTRADTGADYRDPSAEDLGAFRLNEPDGAFDAEDIPPEADDQPGEGTDDQDTDSDKEQGPVDADRLDSESDDLDSESDADDLTVAPVLYASDMTPRTTKPQVLRRDNLIVTRVPTDDERALGRESKGMLGQVTEEGKFTKERARRPRLEEDPDYVHFRGKWVLSPLRYPLNQPSNAPWDFLDPTLGGNVESVKELGSKERSRMHTLLGRTFEEGVRVSQWNDALRVLEGAGFVRADMRLYTPWGGVLTPFDSAQDVEVLEGLDDEDRAAIKDTEKRQRYGRLRK